MRDYVARMDRSIVREWMDDVLSGYSGRPLLTLCMSVFDLLIQQCKNHGTNYIQCYASAVLLFFAKIDGMQFGLKDLVRMSCGTVTCYMLFCAEIELYQMLWSPGCEQFYFGILRVYWGML